MCIINVNTMLQEIVVVGIKLFVDDCMTQEQISQKQCVEKYCSCSKACQLSVSYTAGVIWKNRKMTTKCTQTNTTFHKLNNMRLYFSKITCYKEKKCNCVIFSKFKVMKTGARSDFTLFGNH